ncbi:hypothetical protein HK100_006839 [Physocladia obscura]|uniref:Uncharacterized protein n=1 Tax=Physocladia obscura TaxID=109957 RepID=A0AAD5SPZ3_9FUNG|nr:hypothetical protein HK100_006839 [Physocladia obscura]
MPFSNSNNCSEASDEPEAPGSSFSPASVFIESTVSNFTATATSLINYNFASPSALSSSLPSFSLLSLSSSSRCTLEPQPDNLAVPSHTTSSSAPLVGYACPGAMRFSMPSPPQDIIARAGSGMDDCEVSSSLHPISTLQMKISFLSFKKDE